MARLKTYLIFWLIIFSLALTTTAYALVFSLPAAGNDVVGELQTITSVKGDTLSSIGIKHDIGYGEMAAINPDAPVTGKIPPGSIITIPARFILPRIRNGVVVNLAELRLYYFPEDEPVVYTFPLGAGREGWNTPIATAKLVRKVENPSWTVPESIINEGKRLGRPVKPFYPPGPKNPLGKYALYLGIPGIRIHGTNAPASIGRRASHGCIRLLTPDIKFLYEHVPLDTPVNIIHQETKAGWFGPILYLEAEEPFNEYVDVDSEKIAVAKATSNHPAIIDEARVSEVMQNRDGIPTAIGHDVSIQSIPPDTLPDEVNPE